MHEPPSPAAVAHLQASDLTGTLYTALCLSMTCGGVALAWAFAQWVCAPGFYDLGLLAVGTRAVLWGAGEVLLSFALLQWFVLLHECGHGVLFRSWLPNRVVGHLAGFFSTIPFRSWVPIHNMHHKWTGWQDLDPTTASLVPRPLGAGERVLMNVCWKYWIPAFSVLYRVSNFWNTPRLRRLIKPEEARAASLNALLLAVLYLGICVWVGPLALSLLIGPAVVLSLVMLDPIMLSQHTHIPLENSGGQPVRAFPAHEQAVFTRSLRFPEGFSRWLLLHFDAHELHHIYPFVPGYRLREVGYTPSNEAHWWRWIRLARKMPAEILLFKNRDSTGSEV